jgi:hypothetical protein
VRLPREYATILKAQNLAWPHPGLSDTMFASLKIAAIHLLSLLESELLQRVLLGVTESVKPEVLNGTVRRAVDAFLNGYARR